MVLCLPRIIFCKFEGFVAFSVPELASTKHTHCIEDSIRLKTVSCAGQRTMSKTVNAAWTWTCACQGLFYFLVSSETTVLPVITPETSPLPVHVPVPRVAQTRVLHAPISIPQVYVNQTNCCVSQGYIFDFFLKMINNIIIFFNVALILLLTHVL